MDPEGSFPLSEVPKNSSKFRQIDPVHVQTTHFLYILLYINLQIYAWVKQVIFLNQTSLPKRCTYDVTNIKINTRIYRVFQEERSIFWEFIVTVILSKNIYVNMCPIPNGFRDTGI